MTLPHPAQERDRTAGVLAGPVVVGFDGSPEGDDALHLGRQLAALTSECLIVAVVQRLDLYVVPDPVLVADLDVEQSEAAAALVEQAAEALGEEGPDWRRAVVAARSPALGLHHVIERESAGLVVLGRTHREGVARAVLGTTAGRLLHGSPCPVAVAPSGWGSRTAGVRRIATAYNGSAESLAALRVAADLAGRAGTTLDAIAVFERPPAADPSFAVTTQGYTEQVAELRTSLEHRLARALQELPGHPAARPQVIDGHAPDTLVRQSAETDLLVVGSRGYGPLRSVVLGDVATKLATSAECALVVVPRHAGTGG